MYWFYSILYSNRNGITTIRQVVDKKAACLSSFSWVSTIYYLPISTEFVQKVGNIAETQLS